MLLRRGRKHPSFTYFGVADDENGHIFLQKIAKKKLPVLKYSNIIDSTGPIAMQSKKNQISRWIFLRGLAPHSFGLSVSNMVFYASVCLIFASPHY